MLFLDEHYDGLREYLEALGWKATSVQKEGLTKSTDKTIVEYVKEKDFILITQDEKPALLAKMLGVPCVWVSLDKIAKLVHGELNKMKIRNQ
jgi:predicted nuclease of predicted toxin-antitoxin system